MLCYLFYAPFFEMTFNLAPPLFFSVDNDLTSSFPLLKRFYLDIVLLFVYCVFTLVSVFLWHTLVYSSIRGAIYLTSECQITKMDKTKGNM